jgi:hypothetical protein
MKDVWMLPSQDTLYPLSTLFAVQVCIETTLIREFGPQKKKYSLGITVVQTHPSGNFLLGTGEGLLAEASGAPHFKKLRSAKFPMSITSIAVLGSGNHVFVGCGNSQMYCLDYESFELSLLGSCHGHAITSIAFPRYQN